MPKIWEIMNNFKNLCKAHGWKTCESEDWIEVDEKYHNFLCAKSIHPACFKSIVKAGKCIIREGLSYRVVEASYIAWLFSETPTENVLGAIFENPELLKKVALYDLSPLLEGKNTCSKLNNTDSHVFDRFEKFLRKEMKVKFEPFLIQTEVSEDCTIANVA